MEGELLRPPEVPNVRRESRMLFWDVRQVPIGQADTHRLTQFLGHFDVVRADLIPDAPGTGVQRDPHCSVEVLGEFNEVVAATEGSQGELPLLVVLIGRCPRFVGKLYERVYPDRGRRRQYRVVLAGAHWYATLDAGADVSRFRNL